MTETLAQVAQALSSHISIFDIYVGKRRRKDYGDMEDLKKDMQENGQITAITVCPPTEEDRQDSDYKGENWSLVAGGRRFRAALELGWTTIRAIDRESMDELTRRVLELAENLKRKDMSFVEIAQAKMEMFQLRKEQNPEITQAEVAKEIGETPANFSRDINVAQVLEQRPELKQASSKKAVLRQAKMADHFEARKVRDEVTGHSYMTDLAQRMVTGDMRQWLRTLPEGFADLCIPDFPYGIDEFSQGQKSLSGLAGISHFDDSDAAAKDLFVDAVPQLIRITKKTGWIMCFMSELNYEYLRELFENCCTVHFDYCGSDARLPQRPECKYHKCEEPRWFWYRPNSQNNPRYPELHAKNMIEHILVYNRGEGKLLRPCDNVLVYDAEYGDRIHATQKPIEMLKDLISRVTLPGETVVDPCFGSGAHLAAGAALARDIWGCELNPVIRGPALGYVSQYYQGVAPRGRSGDTASFIDARAELSEEEAEILEDFDELDGEEMIGLEEELGLAEHEE